MFAYRAYGQSICSELQLPGLSVEDDGCDVSIRLGEVTCDYGDLDDYLTINPHEASFCWQPVGKILVREGHEIIVEPGIGSSEGLVRHFLLTSAIAMLFHQRNDYVLHASAVEINGSCIAFIGESGWGKSTTAGYLTQHNFNLVVDDVLPVFLNSSQPVVFPGFAYNRVRPDAALFLGYSRSGPNSLADLPQTPLPLKRIYLLQRGTAPKILPMPPREAFINLLTHSYASHFTGVYKSDILALTGATTWHFEQAAKLAQSIPMFRLERPLSHDALPELARLIEEDVTSDFAYQGDPR